MSDQNTTPGPGGAGAEDVWKNIDRAYDVEHKHRQRQQKLLARELTMSQQIFQSGMLGLMLIGESEQPLVPGHGEASGEGAAVAKEAAAANP